MNDNLELALRPTSLNQGSRKEKVVVLIPAFNEQANIQRVIRDVQKAVPGIDIVVTNDGSKDATAKLAEAAGAKVISHPYNMGYGAACQTGYKYACRHGYDYAIQMDADGQHEPHCVKDLLEAIRDPEVDIVLGSRWLSEVEYKGPWIRKFGKHFFSFLATTLTGLNITDPTTGFQALGRKVMSFYTTEIYPVDFPDADMIIVLNRAGFRVKEIPVIMYRDESGQSMHSGILRPIYYGIKMMLSISMTLLRDDRKLNTGELLGHLNPRMEEE